ncbi:hypothetical protein evm_009333 [Chilo suppressalis]|nr:hypothetical protein evm_009333 [Chilo suppressalis]
MDYVVGGVAALISGNVTPNRPKLVRRALTPTKHQPSPNVTPKSEVIDDRSIFLSPSVQKKKAIVKKSPKRIFQNPDLDVTGDGENTSSPKADKVKKHLQEDLEGENNPNVSFKNKSPKNKLQKIDIKNNQSEETESPQSANENTPKKKKKRNSTTEDRDSEKNILTKKTEEIDGKLGGEQKTVTTKKGKKKVASNVSVNNNNDLELSENVNIQCPKKKKKKKRSGSNQVKSKTEIQEESTISVTSDKKNKKSKKKQHKKDTFVNPNAITNEDTDSEHESDNEILSENEEANKEILKNESSEESSDEEEPKPKEKKIEQKEKSYEERNQEEVKQTLFVGNVPFSKNCKKVIKRLFSKYGAIETVRIRTVPVKDARVTPKLAVIKNEIHPERTTVNLYVKFQDESSVHKALAENNTVIDGCHLRVSRSDSTGAEHDPRNAVFVGNIPFALEDEALRERFEKCGEIVSVRIIRDKKTNAGKGFGYVNFASKDGVELALGLSDEDLIIKNKVLRVKRCTQSTHKKKQQSGKNLNVKNQGHNMQGTNQNKFGGRGPKQWEQKDGMSEGAQRRIMKKRKSQEIGDGPSEKKMKHIDQPQKEKKTRKEFVGMTAEKKKVTFTILK